MSSFSLKRITDSVIRFGEIHNKKVIPGEGPSNAKLVMVGEAGGREEEKLGRPFVGRAGRFLNKSLSEVGIDRNKIYITNVVKMRWQGRPPPSAIEEWLPLLKEELEAVKPRIVVLLGDVAVKAVLDKSYTIGNNHGQLIRKDGQGFLVMPHPSAAMRFNRMRLMFKSDMDGLRQLLGEK
ncbi:MAG: uracil-DNA glycosylase [Candidatus Aenigmatarchaeota archaeon]